MPNNTDILLRLLLEDRFSKDMDKAIDHFEAKLKKATSLAEVESLERQWKEVREAIEGVEKEAIKAAREQEKAVKAQISATEKARRAEIHHHETMGMALESQGKIISGQLSQIRARASAMIRFSSDLAMISRTSLVAGTAIVGGIFAEANNYVKNAKEATAITRAWTAETDSLAKARERVDKVLAREALPMLRQVAQFANQAAGFVETHPEIVQAALNTGKTLIALGAVGIVASKGIKLWADAKYLFSVPMQLQAAQLQVDAAREMLIAAHLMGGKKFNAPVPGTGANAIGGLGKAGAIGFGLAVSASIIYETTRAFDALSDKLIETGGAGEAAGTGMKIVLGTMHPLARTILGLGDASKDAVSEISRAIGQIAGSENEAAIVSAFTKFKEDGQRITQEANEKRKKIIADAEKEIVKITQQYAQQRASINRQADKARAGIIRNFSKNSTKEEADYAKERADIIKNAGEEIQKIEQRHKENIRKLTLDHNDRVEELTAARDALGLAKEMRRFDRERSEAERETNQEIAQRRRDVAIRLQELASQFAAERAQRQADFEEQLAENAKKRQEQLAEAAKAHADEMQQLRANKEQQLRELQEGLIAERRRRRETFIAEIRDLDASLLGERNLKNRYYNLMLADAEKFFAAWRAKMGGSTSTAFATASGSAGGVPKKDYGGYVERGLYRMAWNGAREFVMSNATTRAAEKVIGGQLSQAALLQGLAGRQVTWNDQRRFDGRIGLAERRAIMDDTRRIIQEMLQ